MTDMIERLASIEHARWASWQRHLHSKCVRRYDGALVIPAGYVEALERQIATPYEQLTEAEKEADRKEARAALSALEEPSEAMIQAGVDAFYNLTGDGRYQPIEKDISTAFAAMIKAAKEEE